MQDNIMYAKIKNLWLTLNIKMKLDQTIDNKDKTADNNR